MAGKPNKDQKNAFLKRILPQAVPLVAALFGIWVIGIERSIKGSFDDTSVGTPLSLAFPQNSFWELHVPEGQHPSECPGPECLLNPYRAGSEELVAKGWVRSSKSLADRATSASLNGMYFVRIDTKLPAFATDPHRMLGFDVLGIAGKNWRLFVNGVERAKGRGGVFDQAIPFLADGGREGDPLTIGFEVQVGRDFAPGLFSDSVPFMSPVEFASTIRAAYRGIDKERILPEAYARTILAVVAALGCLFTPFHLEILSYSLGATLWNLSRLMTADMVEFPWQINVDFVTFDAAIRCGLYASIAAFLALFFRQKKSVAMVPIGLFVGLGVMCLIAGRTGFASALVPLVERQHYLFLSILLSMGAAYAYNTWRVTKVLPNAKFRARVAIISLVLLAINAITLFLHQATILHLTDNAFLNSHLYGVYASKYAEIVMLFFGVIVALEWALVVRDRQKVLQRFGMVVDPRVLKELIQSSRVPAIRSEQVIVLFVDLRSFTNMCESSSPAEVNLALNEYLDVVTRAVQEHNGVIDKFAGDSVMALWGIPVAAAGDPMDSVRAAIAIRKGMHELNSKRRERGDFILSFGVGIHVGPAIFGPVGNQQRIDFTAIGPTINISSRLQSFTKEKKVDILISQSLYAMVSNKVLCADLGHVTLRGVTRDTHILQLLGAEDLAGNLRFYDLKLERELHKSKPGVSPQVYRNLIEVDYSEEDVSVDQKTHEGAA